MLSSLDFLTSPALRVRSWPPPWMTLVAAPLPSPPIMATFKGCWKYSEMPSICALVVEPSSHMSRKKAIIAVTKSA